MSMVVGATSPPRSHAAHSDAMIASSNKVPQHLPIPTPVPHFQPINFVPIQELVMDVSQLGNSCFKSCVCPHTSWAINHYRYVPPSSLDSDHSATAAFSIPPAVSYWLCTRTTAARCTS